MRHHTKQRNNRRAMREIARIEAVSAWAKGEKAELAPLLNHSTDIETTTIHSSTHVYSGEVSNHSI